MDTPAASISRPGSVHQTARVRSVTGGSGTVCSPTISFVDTSLRTNPTTWFVTSTSPKHSSASPSERWSI